MKTRVDYQKIIKESGTEIELTYFFKIGKYIAFTPPDHTEVINKILKILKGTGISKITITLLDKNLAGKNKWVNQAENK